MDKRKSAVAKHAHQAQDHGVRHLTSVFPKTPMAHAGCMTQKPPNSQL